MPLGAAGPADAVGWGGWREVACGGRCGCCSGESAERPNVEPRAISVDRISAARSRGERGLAMRAEGRKELSIERSCEPVVEL
eukprot:205108-Prymnesium_polylepis.1